MFPGTSDPLGFGTGGNPQPEWSETTAANTPSDRRGLGAAGPFTLDVGETMEVTYALVYSRAANGEHLEQLEDMADDLHTSYDNGNLGGLEPLSIGHQPARPVQATVGPNPASDVLNIVLGDVTSVNITVLDAMGKVVATDRANGSGLQQLDIEALPAGIYIVRLTDGNNVSNHKIVKE